MNRESNVSDAKMFPRILQVNPLIVKFPRQIIVNFFAAAVGFVAGIKEVERDPRQLAFHLPTLRLRKFPNGARSSDR